MSCKTKTKMFVKRLKKVSNMFSLSIHGQTIGISQCIKEIKKNFNISMKYEYFYILLGFCLSICFCYLLNT